MLQLMETANEFEKNVQNSNGIETKNFLVPNFFGNIKGRKLFEKNNIIRLSEHHKMCIDLVNTVLVQSMQLPKLGDKKSSFFISTAYRKDGGDHDNEGFAIDIVGLPYNNLFKMFTIIVNLIDNKQIRNFGLYLGYKDQSVPAAGQADKHIHLVHGGRLGKNESVGFELVNKKTIGTTNYPKTSPTFPERKKISESSPEEIEKYNKFLELARKSMNGENTQVSLSGFNLGASGDIGSSGQQSTNTNRFLTLAESAYNGIFNSVFTNKI